MKSSKLVVLYLALALATPGVAFAQDTTVNGTVDAAVGATVDSNGVTVNANGSANGGADINPNENGATDAGVVVDGDANDSTASMKCEELGSAASIEAMGKTDMSALGAATKVSIIPVADCDDATRSALASAGATGLNDALNGNAAVTAAVQARGATLADVIGATVDGDTVTVYVESDDVSGSASAN